MIIGTYALIYILVGTVIAAGVVAFEQVDDDPASVGFVCLLWPVFVLIFALWGLVKAWGWFETWLRWVAAGLGKAIVRFA